MNQLAAFFAQMTSPTAAGMGGRAQAGAPQGDAFANILAQFQAAFLNETAAAGATTQPAAVDPLLQAAQNANLSTEDLVAKLKALAGGNGDTSKIDALLAALAPQQSAQDKATSEAQATDATLAGLLTSLQLQIQSQASQQQPTGDQVAATATATTTTPAAAPADTALRGSFALDASAQAQETAHHLQPTDTNKAPDAKAAAQAVENAAIALAPAVAAQPKQKSDQPAAPAASVADKATAKPQPNGTAAQPAEQPATDAKPKQTTDLGAREAPAKPKADSGAPATKPSDSTAQAQTPTVAAAPAPTTNLVSIQQVTTAVAAAPQAGIPLDALAVHIARKFEAGSSQFEISLHPADLGRLDISLNVADDGQVQAVLRAERPETLDLLQRDARSLEQQLRQAGLDVGQGALSFSLSSGNGQRQAPFVGWPAFAQAQDADGVAKQQAASTYIAVRQQGGVDIRV